MKRFLSIFFCVALLLSVIVLAVSGANALPTKGYLLTDYGQQHWFLGSETTKAPDVTDGTVGAMEYGFAVKGLKVTDMVNETYPSDNWTKTNDADFSPAAAPEDIFDIYASYDAENLYLAVVVHDSHWMDSMYHTTHGWLQGDEVYLDLGHYTGPEMVRTYQRIRFRMYSAGVDYYNASGGGPTYESVSRTNHQATKDVDGRAFYAATGENGELANMQGLVTGYSFSSSVPVATGRGSTATVTYEISVSKAAMQNLFAYSDFMNETPGYFYFAPLMKVVGVAGETVNRANYGIGWYSLDGNDTTKFTDAFWDNFTSKNTKLPQVMFLGQKSEYKTLLGSYYEACTEHTYRGVLASTTEYKWVCTKCGYETAKKTLPTKPYLFSDFGQEYYFLGNEASYLPDVTDGKVSDREYTFVKKGIKVTDMINDTYGVWTKTNDDDYNPAAAPEDTFDIYASYGDDMLYIAVVSHDNHWVYSLYNETHGWLQSDDLYLNIGQNPGTTMTNTHSHMRFNLYSNGVEYMNESGDKVLYSSTSRLNHQGTVNVQGGAYYLATEENGELGEDLDGVIEAYSFSSDRATTEGQLGATLTYEIAIDLAAIRTKYNAGISTDSDYFYFAPRMKVVGVKSDTFNRSSYGLAYYSVDGSNTEIFTDEVKANFTGWNTKLPHVMFFGESSEFSTLLGDKYEACTSHDYRYILASEAQHKEICGLCGYVPTDEGADHTYDDGVVTTHPTNAKDGVKTYICTACGITKTEAIDKLGPTNPENKGKNSYKVMGSNILMASILEKGTPTTRFEDVMTAFEGFDPDIFGLQECDALWHAVLDGENGFKTLGYAQAVTGFGELNNPIYYKTDKFEVLDCGLTKYNVNSGYNYTWALFEVIETGERFIVSCTHFTWMDYDKSVDTAEARELVAGLAVLEAKYGVPVIAVGDYNSTMAEEAYTVMTDAYSSGRDDAAEKVNMEYKTMITPGKAGNAPSTGTFVLDHIFYTENKVIGEKYEVFIGPEAYAYSDHLPNMLTFKLYCEQPEQPEQPEDIFEVEGQKHTYVGEATTDAPTLSSETFDATKYNEVAGVDLDNVNGDEGFVIGDGINIGHFKVYMTYDDGKIYLASEVDDKDFKGSESATFTIRTLIGKMEITLAADGTLTDGKSVVTNSRVFTPNNGEGAGIVVYALELDRAAVMQINTMTDGDADTFNVAVTNNDNTGVIEYGVDDGEETIGHTFILSSNPNSDTITEDNGSSSVTITGQFVSEAAEEVISVNLSWTVPVFTYTVSSEWDTVNFVNAIIEGSGKWSDEPANITVTNKSNQDISAAFSFTTTIAGSNITGKFTSDDAGNNEITALTLESAETNSNATSDTAYFFVTGGALTKDHTDGASIGNITVTISALVNN